MSELAILSELEKACDLIDALLAAGMDEADVKETLARFYEVRSAAYPSLRSEQKAALTVAINEGPWFSEHKRMLVQQCSPVERLENKRPATLRGRINKLIG